MKVAELPTFASLFVSLLLIPAGLTVYLTGSGAPPGDGLETTVFGFLALLPGFLMGGAALWVAAHD